jgi:1-deoxy-D-xylulose-5-phosphate synthase
MIVASPMNEEELRNMMYTAQLEGMGPFAIRYPKGRGVMPKWKTPLLQLEVGKGRMIRDGRDAVIITLGHVGNYAVEACAALEKTGHSVAHFDLRFLKPLDEDGMHEIFRRFKIIVTVEDGSVMGGMGSAILEFMADHGYTAQIVRLGVPDHFIEQGSVAELHRECGFDTQGIIQALSLLLS